MSPQQTQGTGGASHHGHTWHGCCRLAVEWDGARQDAAASVSMQTGQRMSDGVGEMKGIQRSWAP